MSVDISSEDRRGGVSLSLVFASVLLVSINANVQQLGSQCPHLDWCGLSAYGIHISSYLQTDLLAVWCRLPG